MLFDFLQKKGSGVELAELIVELGRGVEEISRSIIRADEKKLGTINPSGEEQIAMDVEANDILVRYVKTNPYVASYGSEELDELQKGDDPKGIFSVFFDPLDGSSLFDVNFSVGTIVGIYKGQDVIGRTPRDQVAALYALYGPRTTMVVSMGQGVQEFLLTKEGWEPQVEIATVEDGKKYFAPGNLRATQEREDYLNLVIQYMKEQYTLRYSGGMVPDVNHILKKGSGVFLYPGMPSAPQGKLRLLYECGPMAYLVEQAGGASSDGKQSILDVKISDYHQRTPVFLGSLSEVKRATAALQN